MNDFAFLYPTRLTCKLFWHLRVLRWIRRVRKQVRRAYLRALVRVRRFGRWWRGEMRMRRKVLRWQLMDQATRHARHRLSRDRFGRIEWVR